MFHVDFFQEKDQLKLKNAGSWSSLANMGGGQSATKKTNAMQSFELFRKQAKQKEERV